MARVCRASGYRILSLAVMPDHLHAVIAADGRDPARVVGHLKRGGTDGLIAEEMHPFANGRGGLIRSCWADQSWQVYLDTSADVERAKAYVRANPEREGLPPQQWSLVE